MQAVTRCLGMLVLVALLGSGAQAGPADDEASIRQRLEQWRSAFNARDAAGACDLFAPDLAYSIPGIIQGDHERMCGNVRRLFSRPGLALTYDEPLIHEILVSGSIAIVRLRWTLTTQADGRRDVTTEEGLDVFTRQADGRWAISRFIAF
jgi:ketosteroid isomerase-like protein